MPSSALRHRPGDQPLPVPNGSPDVQLGALHMVARASTKRNRTYTTLDGLRARAGRAHEDPQAMTSDAILTRLGKHIATALKKNPDLTPKQAANAGRLLLRAEMAELAAKSAAARRRDLDATRLEDCGEQ